jgi:hypothetical protein
MAQDLGVDQTAGPSVTIPTGDVTDTNATSQTAIVNFGNPFPPEMGYELTLTMAAGVVTGYVALRVYWAHDGTNAADVGSGEVVGIDDGLTSGGDSQTNGSFKVKAQYAKFDLLNESGGATLDGTASNTALVLYDLFGDQA